MIGVAEHHSETAAPPILRRRYLQRRVGEHRDVSWTVWSPWAITRPRSPLQPEYRPNSAIACKSKKLDLVEGKLIAKRSFHRRHVPYSTRRIVFKHTGLPATRVNDLPELLLVNMRPDRKRKDHIEWLFADNPLQCGCSIIDVYYVELGAVPAFAAVGVHGIHDILPKVDPDST